MWFVLVLDLLSSRRTYMSLCLWSLALEQIMPCAQVITLQETHADDLEAEDFSSKWARSHTCWHSSGATGNDGLCTSIQKNLRPAFVSLSLLNLHLAGSWQRFYDLMTIAYALTPLMVTYLCGWISMGEL